MRGDVDVAHHAIVSEGKLGGIFGVFIFSIVMIA